MNWILIATIGYFLLSLEGVISKYLLTGAFSDWARYLFFVSLLSLFSLFFFPFGLHWWGWKIFLWAVFSGIIFFFSLFFLFKSLVSSVASRSFVLYGAVSTLIIFLLSIFLWRKVLSLENTVSVFLLVIGGFFISFKATENRFFRNFKKIVLSGILAGIYLVILKWVYDNSNFVSGYIFSRIGLFIPALGFLVIPDLRKKIFNRNYRKGFKKKKKKISIKTVLLVKILAGVGTFLVSFSISIGSLTIINALVAVQYLFTFFLSMFLALFFREFYKEKVSVKDLVFKLVGVVLVIVGIVNFNLF